MFEGHGRQPKVSTILVSHSRATMQRGNKACVAAALSQVRSTCRLLLFDFVRFKTFRCEKRQRIYGGDAGHTWLWSLISRNVIVGTPIAAVMWPGQSAGRKCR